MIVMNLELDNLFGFEEFDINFTYPKKIINSSIENEHLEGKPNFRYKKVNIIMGANASGKTSIGRALMAIFNFISKKNCNYLIPCIKNKNKSAKFLVDFVSDTNTDIMYRVVGVIYPENKVDVIVYTAKISKSDSYEKVVQKLIEIPVSEGELKNIESEDGNYLYRLNLPFNLSWLFSFTNDNSEKILEKDDGILNIKILQAVLKTLDKSITKVEKLKKENDNSETNMYSITLNSENIIIQNGKILN
ncbi:MAG: AAA family ATPase, partial [Cetobacterium sp.]